QLVVRMATENRDWGYTRIQGALANLSHDVGRGSMATILRQHGIERAPERQKRATWQEFLKAHWEVLAAADFFTVEAWTATGLKRYAVLFVIELATRRVQIAGIASEPDSAWVVQCGRQLPDAVDGLLVGKRFLFHDRDPLFSDAFRETLAATGVETVRLPPRAPNLNAHAERYVRIIKEGGLNRMIFVGERSLRRAITEFVTHYHHERNHQGVGNVLIFPAGVQPRSDDDRVACRERLGGLRNHYHRPAA